ncbi:MAG: hypothetical protein GXP54_12100 [Deltaproteobacteria bacterium]|nr:hypothetical protein [Deltaproteobacteria bacterium]
MKEIILALSLTITLAGCAKSLPEGADASQNDAFHPDDTYHPEDVPTPFQTCREAIRCITEKGCYSMLCAGGCVDGVDAQTAKRLQDLMGCAKDRCDGFSQWESTQMALCVYMDCRKDIEPCTNTGDADCVDTLTCAQQCQVDETCLVDCLDAATYDARLAALMVSACIESECPEALFNPARSLDCISSNGPCHDEYQDCITQ